MELSITIQDHLACAFNIKFKDDRSLTGSKNGTFTIFSINEINYLMKQKSYFPLDHLLRGKKSFLSEAICHLFEQLTYRR